MDKQLRQKALKEASRIGDELLLKIDTDKNELLWPTMLLDPGSTEFSWRKIETIYSGNSGIILFFAELYNVTGDRKYLEAAIEGLNRLEVYCKNTPSGDNSLYSGRMGVSFVMLRLYELTENVSFLEKALYNAKEYCRFFNNKNNENDLLSGVAGTILGFIHLHAASGEDWLIEEITNFTEILLERAHAGQVGLYWGRSFADIRGLCGFSHGTAGIGFVFLELGNYFNNKALYKIAEEAFAYENKYYDKKINNWPDFRMYHPNNGAEDLKYYSHAYEKKKFDFFKNGADLNAWCHGAAGIGLARLRAWELLKKKQYKKEAENAVAKTVSTDIVESEMDNLNFTLCHAHGGNAELFIQAEEMLGKKNYESYTEQIIKKLLAYKDSGAPYMTGIGLRAEADTSLFMGNAGIGYFLLRAIAPQKVPSILAPPVNKENKNELLLLDFQISSINKVLISKQYMRTSSLLEKLLSKEFNIFLKNEEAFSNKKLLKKFINEHKTKLTVLHRKCLQDAFNLETKRVKIENAITSNILVYFREYYEGNSIKQLLIQENSAILKQKLILIPNSQLTFVNWNWSSTLKKDWISNLSIKPEKQWIFLRGRAEETQEEYISPVIFILLEAFKTGAIVEDVIEATTTHFDISEKQEIPIIKEQLLQQIKEVAMAGFLMIEH